MADAAARRASEAAVAEAADDAAASSVMTASPLRRAEAAEEEASPPRPAGESWWEPLAGEEAAVDAWVHQSASPPRSPSYKPLVDQLVRTGERPLSPPVHYSIDKSPVHRTSHGTVRYSIDEPPVLFAVREPMYEQAARRAAAAVAIGAGKAKAATPSKSSPACRASPALAKAKAAAGGGKQRGAGGKPSTTMARANKGLLGITPPPPRRTVPARGEEGRPAAKPPNCWRPNTGTPPVRTPPAATCAAATDVESTGWPPWPASLDASSSPSRALKEGAGLHRSGGGGVV